jgi:membrane protein required for colicin V production
MGLDLIIAIIVIAAAIGGFRRGRVQEVLALASWILAALALYFFHPALTEGLRMVYTAEPAVSLFALALLLLIPHAAIKVIIGNATAATGRALPGPVDRVLGFGFGAIKGALIAVFAFAVLVTGFDETWGYAGRPQWITGARTYPAADAFARQLLPSIAIRRDRLRREGEAHDAAAARAGR